MSPPIKMLLFCPECGLQHVDRPDPKIGWDNPPHKSHLCARCRTIWRPADVETEGAAWLQTIGQADTWDVNKLMPYVKLESPRNRELPVYPEYRWVQTVLARMGYSGPLFPTSCPLEDWLTELTLLRSEETKERYTRDDLMTLAHSIDVGCWVSYSGLPKNVKRFMEKRRQAAIAEARRQLEES